MNKALAAVIAVGLVIDLVLLTLWILEYHFRIGIFDVQVGPG